jgi:hypothetical protein
MSWIKVAERVPPENEQVLIHDDKNSRMEIGCYTGGRWYVQDSRTGERREITNVTHWGWLLDFQLNDESDDD